MGGAAPTPVPAVRPCCPGRGPGRERLNRPAARRAAPGTAGAVDAPRGGRAAVPRPRSRTAPCSSSGRRDRPRPRARGIRLIVRAPDRASGRVPELEGTRARPSGAPRAPGFDGGAIAAVAPNGRVASRPRRVRLDRRLAERPLGAAGRVVSYRLDSGRTGPGGDGCSSTLRRRRAPRWRSVSDHRQ